MMLSSSRYLLCWYVIAFSFLLSACDKKQESVQGYVEGKYTYVTSAVSGRVVQFNAKKGDEVTVNAVLATLSPEPETDAFNAANAAVTSAKERFKGLRSERELAEKTVKRIRELRQKNVVQQAELDTAETNLTRLTAESDAAEAGLLQAEAQRKQVAWQVGEKTVLAPIAGRIFDRYYEEGEWVVAGHPLFSVLQPARKEVIFYVTAPQLAKLTINQPLIVRCPGCESAYSASVNFISPSPEYTPPVIYSEKTNAKLIYRIEGQLRGTALTALHPGQPVTVSF